MKKIYVVVTLQKELVHDWAGVVNAKGLTHDVSYLQYPHRHLFYIKATKAVNHDDRDVEIICLKNDMEEYLDKAYPDKHMGHTSCEMLAEKLVDQFGLASCSVMEDNENGAVVMTTGENIL